MTADEDLNWASMLRFDQEGGLVSRRHDAEAAGRRGDASERARYLREAAQLEMLPRLWEFGVRLTVEEYQDAVRVRSWIIHEQTIARHEEMARRHPSSAHWDRERIRELQAGTRHFWSPDGHLLYVAVRDDGRFVANHGFLTPEWAERLRQDMPQHAKLLKLYERNQRIGLGHANTPDGTPLVGVHEPDPVRLWRERIEGELRRRSTGQA